MSNQEPLLQEIGFNIAHEGYAATVTQADSDVMDILAQFEAVEITHEKDDIYTIKVNRRF